MSLSLESWSGKAFIGPPSTELAPNTVVRKARVARHGIEAIFYRYGLSVGTQPGEIMCREVAPSPSLLRVNWSEGVRLIAIAANAGARITSFLERILRQNELICAEVSWPTTPVLTSTKPCFKSDV